MADISKINEYDIKDAKAREMIANGNFVSLSMLNEAQSYKVDKVDGKGLSENDYTDEDKEKVDNIPIKTSDLQNDSGYITANRYTNVLVPMSAFAEDSTFGDYSYKANIIVDGVTENDYANISFALSDVASKNYAPICTTDNGIVSIYAVELPSADITIPLIEVVKV